MDCVFVFDSDLRRLSAIYHELTPVCLIKRLASHPVRLSVYSTTVEGYGITLFNIQFYLAMISSYMRRIELSHYKNLQFTHS